MRSIAEKTDQVRVRIPVSVKERLSSIATQKNIPFGSVLLFLINNLLRRKPDLLDVLDNAIDLLKIEKDLQAQKLKVVNAYNMMQLHFGSIDKKVDSRCRDFLAESEIFVRQLSEKRDE